MTEDARLYGLPAAAIAMFKPVLPDMDKFSGIGINLAVAHINVGNFATAGKLLCEVMDKADNGHKLDAAATLLDATVHHKAPTQGEHFAKALTTLDAACERGNEKAMQIRHQMASVKFDISLG